MNYPPSVDLAFDQIPNDPRERHELFVRMFGQCFVWALSEASNISKDFVESTEKRETLSPRGRQYYEEIAMMFSDEKKPFLYKFGDAELKNFAKIILLISA
jgi:hypothetical protein